MNKLDIVQVRGKRNIDMTDDVRTFMSQYESWFNRRAAASKKSLHTVKELNTAICG